MSNFFELAKKDVALINVNSAFRNSINLFLALRDLRNYDTITSMFAKIIYVVNFPPRLNTHLFLLIYN
jgi:hypothetical protein